MALVNAFSSLSLAAPKAAGLGFKKAVAAFAQPAARVSGARVAFAVEAKQNKKARVIQSRNERLRNKMRKSEITTRMKKVFLKAEALKAASACTDADVGELETLISEATKAVDKAVGKGVLHKNTGARRKSRMSKYKQELRRDKGLLTA
jgi:small subunit ribosomal protein S20|mmetsp:Transcript_679/g.2777  ORF Transcript_679/g.2777 Transcript_679/m.2777 type:complete len:149 (-) Transcript_679:190-636(-)